MLLLRGRGWLLHMHAPSRWVLLLLSWVGCVGSWSWHSSASLVGGRNAAASHKRPAFFLSEALGSSKEVVAKKTGKKGKQKKPQQSKKEHKAAPAEMAVQDVLDEPCNVALTHCNADFDSLAGAVALAKLWSVERPDVPTHVVTPRGVNPLVARFLAYHKHLLPVRGFKTIREEDIVAIGIVDTQSKDRIGPAGVWLASAEHVAVVDHHTSVNGDIEPDEYICEPVGSATTVIVEKLRELATSSPEGEPRAKPALTLTETEATLFALGIRADTGALTYPATTPRDAYALAWLMDYGCSQSAIAEFGQARLSATQRDLLSEAMSSIELTRHEGIKLGSVMLDTGRGFVTGMSSVCEEMLQLLGCDVVLVGVIHYNAKQQAFLSLIGRCSARARGVDLNAVLSRWKGGGHPAASAASIKLCSGEVVPDPKAVGKEEGEVEGKAARGKAAEGKAAEGKAAADGTADSAGAVIPQAMTASKAAQTVTSTVPDAQL